MSRRREQCELVELLRERGLRVDYTKAGHWKVFTPGGVVFLPSTPSDHRSRKNNISLLRRHGVAV